MLKPFSVRTTQALQCYGSYSKYMEEQQTPRIRAYAGVLVLWLYPADSVFFALVIGSFS